ncbi:peptidyl-alpha-hydroxyglycine alpha-amidating lyase 1-like isoform X2 [Leptidea sinapis]|uniref:peptidyl-alpha-hydroxyglycine alpha-amidating lyase 1-like isoform X2 n=1 Tax=Leptidea sinapis TaxID=189913 RepID=UPI0021C35353|nr:peptidyl-alpha-hydroxyglycine alpha-amidating lyase 1-like isoform X2 [Leptidea sinapis]
MFNKFIILLCLFSVITAQRYPGININNYFSRNYFDDQQYTKINAGIEKLEHSPQWVKDWPDASVKLGQVSGVAIDPSGHILVFHRASNVWDASTFSITNVYQGIGEAAIAHPTVMVFNETGELVDMWGENLFFIPHGITVDGSGNVWLTDVALHQVFKFTPDQRKVPALTLGEKFVPGEDETHFCKPSAVAVHSSGDFFVADGYCNTRIIKYSADGNRILQWGRRFGSTPFTLNVPHALTLAEEHAALCVADRERGRVACFRSDNGSYVHSYSHWLIGPRLFSVAYSPIHGGRLYVVNGPSNSGVPVRGYVIEYTSGRLIQTFAAGESLSNPHDIAVSPGGDVYVAELNPYRVYKFVDDALRNESFKQEPTNSSHAKPTATVEVSGVGVGVGEGNVWDGWSGAAGGALGAAGAALVALAAMALLNARNRGKRAADTQPLCDDVD